MPLYSYALLSAVLWAISAPIISSGLRSLPQQHRILAVFTGVLASQIAGTIVLGIIVIEQSAFPSVISGYAVIAGILTFPIATGLYYFSGSAFNNRIEFASQFVKIKPIFSVLFAVLILNETLLFISYISLALIVIGTLILIVEGFRGTFNWLALGFGLLTALSWAFGELFIKLGLISQNSISDTFVALSSAALFSLVVFTPAVVKLIQLKVVISSWISPFLLHGIISFSIAYACFFESIKHIGLGKTVLITAFWPILAIFFSSLVNKFKGDEYHIPVSIWFAAIILLMGSIIQAITLV